MSLPSAPTASLDEIEQTLDLARAEVEIAISRLRLVIIGVMSAAIAAAVLTGNMPSLAPVAYEGVLLLNAVLLFAYLRRRVFVPRAVTLWAALFDLASGPVFFALAPPPPGQDVHVAAVWYFFMLPAQLFLFLGVAQLRPSRVVAVCCAVAALGLFWAVLLVRTTGHPAMALASVFILCAGAVSWYAAGRQRTTLEIFARLQLLKRYLPSAAVRRVLERRTSLDALALGGQQVTVTIMATDLRGFTAMSKRFRPEDVVAQLNAYHGAMVEQVDRHGGSLDKFIGDGALVVFGLGTSESPAPDAGAQAAVDCARSMLSALSALNLERSAAGLEPLRMGIGIHTGEVIAGNIGAPARRLEFTVIGDAVNTAVRLESATKELGVVAVASGATFDRLRDRSAMHPIAARPLAGLTDGITLHALD
ncbi:MAG TPA: adenylate/guanylate cyclase domain-containing protein [Candidatus Polarisedimenticolaceae bacterium]|nr:adenylate/guanylate cyclase domain-containing protein [Candidatus Polarisedimenticolaceae bacterium]